MSVTSLILLAARMSCDIANMVSLISHAYTRFAPILAAIILRTQDIKVNDYSMW